MKRFHSSREFLIFLGFLALTVMMTWPWVLHIRDAVSDPGDPYLNSWILWWDYHQTFSDPLHLFNGNIFFPYKYSLAFSENGYGIALLFFPLFALGARPITVHSLATFLAFAFSGYGMFRLARTLTGSEASAWISGLVFAFIPYRFSQLPHLQYIFAGWIPILFESLVLFIKSSTRRRGIWLGFAFFMNALTCIHWLILTLIPLGISAAFVLPRQEGWRNVQFWRRGMLALALSSLVLIPFLLPYQKVSNIYGFVRHAEELRAFSAEPIDWLVTDQRNKLWQGLNPPARGERTLFPGLAPVLLGLAAFFLIKPGDSDGARRSRRLKRFLLPLDLTITACAVLVFVLTGFEASHSKSRVMDHLFTAGPGFFVFVFGVALVVRLCMAYPLVFHRVRHSNLVQTIASSGRSDAFWFGLIWTLTGFFGSLGQNFFFHRLLFEYVPLFRAIRVPARWATIAYVGIALLAGIGARQFVQLIIRHRPNVRKAAIYSIFVFAILFEQRAAPVDLFRGEATPTELTLRLKRTKMAGGIVELPTGNNMIYDLRAADHGKPLVTAYSGFETPIVIQIGDMTRGSRVPDGFIDLLESIPTSYLIVHTSLLAESRPSIESFLSKAIAQDRLRFIRSYGVRDDLYAVTKIEPEAKSEAPLPRIVSLPETMLPVDSKSLKDQESRPPNPIDETSFFIKTQYEDLLGREPDAAGLSYWSGQIDKCGGDLSCAVQHKAGVSTAFFKGKEFQETSFFLYRLYKGVLGRAPTFAEFSADRRAMPKEGFSQVKFISTWITRSEFQQLYPSRMKPDEFVDALFRNIQESSGVDLSPLRGKAVNNLLQTGDRAEAILLVCNNEDFRRADYNEAFLMMQYFVHLRRDADPASYKFWLDVLNASTSDSYEGMVRAFITSKEYRSRFLPTKK